MAHGGCRPLKRGDRRVDRPKCSRSGGHPRLQAHGRREPRSSAHGRGGAQVGRRLGRRDPRVSQAIRRSVRSQGPKCQSGSFILLGSRESERPRPAKTLAEFCWGRDLDGAARTCRSTWRSNVSRLVGSPPARRYDDGGQSTEAVRRKPCSVVGSTRSRRPHRRLQNAVCRSSRTGASRRSGVPGRLQETRDNHDVEPRQATCARPTSA